MANLPSLLNHFFLSVLCHAFCDLPVHVHDAHRHFFPLSDYRFISPWSYWDVRYHGRTVALVEALLAFLCSLYIYWGWRRAGTTCRGRWSSAVCCHQSVVRAELLSELSARMTATAYPPGAAVGFALVLTLCMRLLRQLTMGARGGEAPTWVMTSAAC